MNKKAKSQLIALIKEYWYIILIIILIFLLVYGAGI